MQIRPLARRRLIVLTTAGLTAAAATWAGVAGAARSAPAAPKHVTIATAGGLSFKANRFLNSGLRYARDSYTIRSGGTLTFVHKDKSTDPHTLTAVNKKELPRTLKQIDNCQICSLGNGNQPTQSNPNGVQFVDVGKTGFDERGDSLAIAPFGPASKFSVTVTAPKGTNLYLFCAIHPWMQTVLHVR